MAGSNQQPAVLVKGIKYCAELAFSSPVVADTIVSILIALNQGGMARLSRPESHG